MVEALACGTPVIACNRGSMPELIDDGVTGFLVDSLDAAVDAIGRIDEIDRAACRAAVSARFTVDLMADRYLALVPINPWLRRVFDQTSDAREKRAEAGFFSDFIDPAPAFGSPMMVPLGSLSYFVYSVFNRL